MVYRKSERQEERQYERDKTEQMKLNDTEKKIITFSLQNELEVTEEEKDRKEVKEYREKVKKILEKLKEVNR